MTPRPTLVFSRPDPTAGNPDLPLADSLGTILWLVRMQASSVGDRPRAFDRAEVRTILSELGGRIDAVARLHRRLAGDPRAATIDLDGYLRDIAAAVVAGLSSDRDNLLHFSCDGRCLLPPERALAIGFIVMELVSNAVKYAHPTGVPGEIAVTCTQDVDGMVTVEVSDDGIGLPEGLDPMTADTLGLQLVRSLVAQLDARLIFAHNSLGLSCVLQIPRELRP